MVKTTQKSQDVDIDLFTNKIELPLCHVDPGCLCSVHHLCHCKKGHRAHWDGWHMQHWVEGGGISLKRSQGSKQAGMCSLVGGEDRMSPAVRGWYKGQSCQLSARIDIGISQATAHTKDKFTEFALYFGNFLKPTESGKLVVFSCEN